MLMKLDPLKRLVHLANVKQKICNSFNRDSITMLKKTVHVSLEHYLPESFQMVLKCQYYMRLQEKAVELFQVPDTDLDKAIKLCVNINVEVYL